MKSFSSKCSSCIRFEELLHNLSEQITHTLNGDSITTFTFETKNICIGIFIGLWLAFGLISLEASTGFFRWLIYSPDLSWLLPGP